jgi:hypothetical protein
MRKEILLLSSFVLICLFGADAKAQTTPAPALASAEELVAPASTAKSETNPRQEFTSGVEPILESRIPHPYIYFGPSLMGGGYARLAYRAEAGLNLESRRWVMMALAAYDNGHKVDDADQPNLTGHDRYLSGDIYLRLPWLPAQLSFLGDPDRWFVGTGYRWSQLSTTNYTKGVNGPEIGGGRDFIWRSCAECRGNLSMRISLDWVMAGNDWQNGSHGPDFTLTLPSPRENRHWFLQERIAFYDFHETVTEPSNAELTHQQMSMQKVDNFDEVGVVYRF